MYIQFDIILPLYKHQEQLKSTTLLPLFHLKVVSSLKFSPPNEHNDSSLRRISIGKISIIKKKGSVLLLFKPALFMLFLLMLLLHASYYGCYYSKKYYYFNQLLYYHYG
eukprot:168038_1